jgi:TonB family protein
MRTSDGSERYIGATAISQSDKQFMPIDLPFTPWPNLEDCSAFRKDPAGTHRPIPLYSPNPEHSEKARKAKISGSVTLFITVGVDGMAHDIVATKPLGYGLDENAIAAVQKWKFDPAVRDGKPIPTRMAVEVGFRQQR